MSSLVENGAGSKTWARIISNYYLKYRYMLETPKALNTRNSKNFKDRQIDVDNQQETNKYKNTLVGSSETIRDLLIYIFYLRRRYSPSQL